MKKGQLKQRILRTLSLYPETRNCDIKLTTQLWKEYFPNRIIKREKDGKDYISLEDIFVVYRKDHIKRIRATIQNKEHKYLPTDPVVRKKRKISEEEWRKASFNRFN